MSNINKSNTHIISTPFVYHQPKSVEEATKLLMELSNVKPIAGGTDLIPKIKQRILNPSNIVNLKKIPELRGIKEEKDVVFIGATTKLREIECNKYIQADLPLLYNCIKSIGSVQIRNMGTLGGNVCNASPAADGALGLIALDAIIQIEGQGVAREVNCVDFFTGPSSTVLKKGELVKGFKVPKPNAEMGSCFISIGRTSLDISTISIAVTLEVKNEVVEEVKICLGSVAPNPLRLYDIEKWLKGKKLSLEIIEEVSKMIASSIMPISDIRGTAEYRRDASRGLAKEAITRAWKGEK